MKIHELLLELNIPKLTNDFGTKLYARYNFDESSPGNFESSEEVIHALADLDPTPNKELTFWLCLNYAKGLISRWEDISSRAIPALLKYKALLRKPNLEPKLQIRDINQIKGLSALEDIVEQYQEKDTSSNSKVTDEKEQAFFNSGQAELIYNDAQVKVVVPKTKAASCFFGINTRWCTAAKKYNTFDHYNKKGPLYIVLIKKENKRYQFHFQTDSFMNEKDESINPNKLANKYPILWKIFTPIAEKNKSLQLNNSPSEELIIYNIKMYPESIQYIKNPSEKIQKISVLNYPSSIRYIKNPSAEVQLVAVKKDPYVIGYIKNPSAEVQLSAVKKEWDVFNYIKNPSKEVINYINELEKSM